MLVGFTTEFRFDTVSQLHEWKNVKAEDRKKRINFKSLNFSSCFS